MSKISVNNVWKLFGDTPVVKNVSLQANDGEFLVLVGASGCGKTTTLRMLAGLETPTFGNIMIDDVDVTLVPPGERDVAMVFQSYALYPHMSVYRNLSFGPRSRREPAAEVRERVQTVAKTLGLEKYLNRKPSELSGGQRQRVALGRVMIRHPRLSLLDEPLSNLDAALRVQMRTELVRLQRELKVTTVYVTHDQVEAMTMGDRIAVFDQGVLLQIDTPANLYDKPNSEFVATFIGSPKMNVFDGEFVQANGTTEVRCLGTSVPIDRDMATLSVEERQKGVRVGMRPHDLFLAEECPSRCSVRFNVVVDYVEMTGAESFALVRPVDSAEIINVRIPRSANARQGDTIAIALDPRDMHLFDAQTGERIIEWQGPSNNKTVPAAALGNDAGEMVNTGGVN
jgi:multiple sugar transport system ATP-binding protein